MCGFSSWYIAWLLFSPRPNLNFPLEYQIKLVLNSTSHILKNLIIVFPQTCVQTLFIYKFYLSVANPVGENTYGNLANVNSISVNK